MQHFDPVALVLVGGLVALVLVLGIFDSGLELLHLLRCLLSLRVLTTGLLLVELDLLVLQFDLRLQLSNLTLRISLIVLELVLSLLHLLNLLLQRGDASFDHLCAFLCLR